jgi:hypothetical protein
MDAIHNNIGSNLTDYFTFTEPLLLFMFLAKQFPMNISFPCTHVGHEYSFILSSHSEEIFTIGSNKSTTFTCIENDYPLTQVYTYGMVKESIDVQLHGKLLGFSKLQIEISGPDPVEIIFNGTSSKTKTLYTAEPDARKTQQEFVFPVTVLRSIRPIDKIFMILMTAFLFLITMGFGCKLDLGIVKECLKKPVAPGIGFGCQYLVMPLVSC